MLNSIIHHKMVLPFKKSAPELHTETVLGFKIQFFTYPQFINLFEEIFIFQTYRFSTNNPTPFIIDCGSNIGLSILYFKKAFPSSRILAFEPDKETFMILQENIRLNDLSEVSLFNIALSDEDGEAILYKKANYGSLTMSLMESPDRPLKETVNAQKLSEYIRENVDMIKIDVEGAELKILYDLIANKKINYTTQMLIEYHPYSVNLSLEQFVGVITKADFSCNCYKDELHSGATEVMVHCVKRDLSRQ